MWVIVEKEGDVLASIVREDVCSRRRLIVIAEGSMGLVKVEGLSE